MNDKDNNGNSCLFYTLLNKNYNIAKILLVNGADLKLKDKNNKSYLDIFSNDIETCKYLINIGIDFDNSFLSNNSNSQPIKIRNQNSRNIIHQRDTVGSIIEKRLKLLQEDPSISNLHFSIIDDSLMAVETLVELGSNINVVDMNNNSLLHYCSIYNAERCCEYLLTLNMNVNKVNKQNQTPLHIACEKKLIKIVKMIIDNGGDINMKNNKNETSIEIAERLGFGNNISQNSSSKSQTPQTTITTSK